MPCFKLPVAAAVIAAFCSCASFAQTNQQSMFKEAPSIANPPSAPSAKDESRSGMRIKRRADGSMALEGKMHGGGGVQTNIIVPKIRYDVRIDGPAGVDENGRPTTWSRKIDKAMGHAIVFKGLQAQGYKYEEHRKKKEAEGLVTQLDEWKAKNKATKEYIEKHGPITTKDFIVPGSTPEKSAILSDPEVGVRKENGKLVYYYRGKRIDLSNNVEKPKPKARPITRQKTRLSVSPKKEVADPAVTKIQRTPPKKQYQVDPDEDLRRNPTDVFVDPATLPTMQDLESLFGKTQQNFEEEPESVQTPEPTKEKRGRTVRKQPNGKTTGMVQSLEQLAGFIFGISPAAAQDFSVPAPRLNAADEKELNDIIAEIKKENDRLVDEIKSKNSSQLKSRRQEAGEDSAEDSYLQSASEKNFDPAEFAAEIVNRTQKSLTPEQFEDDVRAILGSLSSSDSPANVVNALADMLESNPEIYTAIPDADLKLQQLSGKVIEVTPPDPKGEATYIFVSYSLSEDVLKDIVERHKGRNDVTLVMRGVPRGMTVHEGIKKIQAIANSVDPIASVIIDPTLFREYGITHVPAVARVGRSPSPLTLTPDMKPGRKFAPLVAKVAGLHNDRWLMEQIEAGEKGDLGVQGNLIEIAEPDMIEEMKKRVALIDWDKKKKEAAKRFWKKQEFKVLPTADAERVREIDPTILVEKDLKDLAGNYIRRAGERVNPLRIRPFTQTILIFNPVSEEEMSRVATFLAQHAQQGLSKPVLIATQIDKKKDWDGYKALADKLDSHVFLMTPEVEYQWHIEKTPSVVTADNRRHIFLVRELGPKEEKANGGTK